MYKNATKFGEHIQNIEIIATLCIYMYAITIYMPSLHYVVHASRAMYYFSIGNHSYVVGLHHVHIYIYIYIHMYI